MTVCETPFFIVCSASSGSTLLSTILDRHHEIAIGPELYVFNKDKIYFENIKSLKSNFRAYLSKGILSRGQDQVKAFFFNRDAYFADDELLVQMMSEAISIRAFFDTFFDRYLKKRMKKIWGEKTGNNALYLDEILMLYSGAKIIHLVRDPKDTICSIKNRGASSFQSVSHWLFNNIAALRYSEQSNYLRVKYEELVRDPENQVIKILEHIGVDIDKSILNGNPDNEYWSSYSKANIHGSWSNDPFRGISGSSIGRGLKEFSDEDQLIFDNLCLSKFAMKMVKMQETGSADCYAVANACGYPYKKSENYKRSRLFTYIYSDYLKRLVASLRFNNEFTLPLFDGCN